MTDVDFPPSPRKAAVALHPGAMYRLGTAELNGSLSLSRRPKEGVKWLKRSAEHATEEFPHAQHELALLHERGIENVVFVDLDYAAELLAQASELGYAPSAFKLGECYEYGKMGCPMDAALSIHYYVSDEQPCSRTAWTDFRALGDARTSLQLKRIEMHVSPSPHGISSAHLVYYLNPIPRLTYGRRKRRKRVWQRLNTPWAISQRFVAPAIPSVDMVLIMR